MAVPTTTTTGPDLTTRLDALRVEIDTLTDPGTASSRRGTRRFAKFSATPTIGATR